MTTTPKLINWIDYSSNVFDSTIQLFGVLNDTNESVCIIIHGYYPYLYAKCLDKIKYDEETCSRFKQILNNELYNNRCEEEEEEDENIKLVECVQKKSIYGYLRQMENVFKITVKNELTLNKLKRLLIENGSLNDRKFKLFDCNVSFVLKYMIDQNIYGCNWIQFKDETKCEIVVNPKDRKSRCVHEYKVFYSNIISCVPNINKIGKFKILSFDIECKGRKGHFPDAKLDPVIQISNQIHIQGNKLDEETNNKFIFVLNGCSPINGAIVKSFDNEKEMLIAWCQFIQFHDPSILTGYNIQNFDIPYLINRSSALKIDNQFLMLGRLLSVKSTMTELTFSSSAFGTRTNMKTVIHGRIILDVIQYMYRNFKLSSYSLNSVSKHFLKNTKEDVHHSMISILHEGSYEDRKRLAVYCLKDAYLPLQLINKLCILINYFELARVSGVPMSYLLERGQQIQVLTMIYRKAKLFDIIVPLMNYNNTNLHHDDDLLSSEINDNNSDSDTDDEGDTKKRDNKVTKTAAATTTTTTAKKVKVYEGATVLSPLCGYYAKPIITLDFASLYPSIMRAHNLCYTTYLTEEEAKHVEDDIKFKSPCGYWFVKPIKRKALLAIILEELLTARSGAKKEMKLAGDDTLLVSILNGRQLAFKTLANSVYGFSGAENQGMLPCIAISASVTAYGREMIEDTKNKVENEYKESKVIYGDTDSVMIDLTYKSKEKEVKKVEECLKIGKELAKLITKTFLEPICLEFEKVYYPFVLIAKKRYTGLLWTKADNYDKIDYKGIEVVRRDNCIFVRQILDNVIKILLIQFDLKGSIEYVKNQIQLLLTNKVDLSKLIISKSLKAGLYKNKQPHSELVEKIKLRDPGNAPSVGDRIPFVIIKGSDEKVYTRSEDPVYVLENNLSIDSNYYLNKQLKKPLLRLFGPIIPNAESVLFSGDHTNKRIKLTPNATFGIMKFVNRNYSCLSCKIPLKEGHKEALCELCESKKTSIYMNLTKQLNTEECKLNKLTVNCQRCQGSMHQEVLCANKECPVYYVRFQIKNEITSLDAKLKRFDF